MKREQTRREAMLNENVPKKKHHPSRQSLQSQPASSQHSEKQLTQTETSLLPPTDDDGRHFHVRK